MKTFLDCIAGTAAPSVFRVVVIKETMHWKDEPTGRQMERYAYVAVAMEWHLAAQGDSVAEALEHLQHVLMTQAYLVSQRPEAMPKPAPEDWQRIATSGTHHRCADQAWAQFQAPGGTPVAHRCTIDMGQSSLRLVPKP